MIFRRLSLALVATAALVSTAIQPSGAQTAQSLDPQGVAPMAASASTAVPALVPFSGLITAPDGKPISGETAVTFLIFKDQEGGEPLFAETQAVMPDAGGRYKIQLGATLANGLPSDLFSTGEARWLEVQAAGQPPQPRVLMASVPYALKAADAATLGGLPASAFLLAGTQAAAGLTAAVSAGTTTASNVTTTGGATGYLPEFSAASSILDSPVFVNGADVGIGTTTPTATLDVNGTALISGTLDVNSTSTLKGPLVFASTGTATASKDYPSQYIKLQTSAYNSATASVIQPRFQLQAEAKSNNTATPTATLNLTSSTSNAAPTETGFYFNANGTINFAKGQTFPGTGTGNGTITGVTAGTGLTGGGESGNVTLNIDSSKVVTSVTAGTGLTGGGTGGNIGLSVDTTKVPLLNSSSNNFAGPVNFQGGLTSNSITLVTTNSNYAFNSPNGSTYGYPSFPLEFQFQTPIGYETFAWQAEPTLSPSGVLSGSMNLIYQGPENTYTVPVETGFSVAGNGVVTVNQSPATQLSITSPQMVIQADETGTTRNAAEQLSIQGATNPLQQLLIGYVSYAGSTGGGFGTIQATWNGYRNTPLMLQPNGGCVCIDTGNAEPYNNPLLVGQGKGDVVADGYATYSSRRFKTNIQTLPDALSKVEKLRGVSYTLKATGKHEVGVIAEEVGQVVPEVVTYEKNGVDAQSVDYTRLTALLIEATKEQQALIQQQQKQIKVQQAQIRVQQRLARLQQAQIARLASQMRTVEAALKDSDRPGLEARTVADLTMKP
jgi:hypothetical protein